MSARYKLNGSTEYRDDVVDLARRRVAPFLDTMGVQTRSLERLLCEAYMQGIKDAVQTMEPRS